MAKVNYKHSPELFHCGSTILVGLELYDTSPLCSRLYLRFANKKKVKMCPTFMSLCEVIIYRDASYIYFGSLGQPKKLIK